jgi:hypothetical protein
MRKGKLTQKEKNLLRRYLVWCYKTTKEELDKVDRYFTQLIADDHILRQLKGTKEYKFPAGDKDYKDLVDQFKAYMNKKESDALKKKFKDSGHKQLNPDYQYLSNRFAAIEKTIIHFLGAKELDSICRLYEQEMTGRIIGAREHH